MNLYIKTENGAAKNHPALEDNIVQVFGLIPPHWEPFVRGERPMLGIYEVLESIIPNYAKVDGVWTDVWPVRSMTTEEKAAKQQVVIDRFNSREQAENWSAWILDEEACIMKPPIPRPDPIEGKNIFWCGADSNWKEAPLKPDDSKIYKFDFFAWQWNEVVV